MTLDTLQSISQQAAISSISPRFLINFPNHDRVFTPQFNHVTGKAYFKFNDTFKSLVSVQVGLRGVIQLSYTKESVDHTNKIISNHYENHLLFDENSYVLTTMSDSGLVFKTGRSLNAAFDLSFPNDIIEKLPSSCLGLGLGSGISSTLAHVNVIYQLYFKVNYLQGGIPDYMEYTTPVTYQGEGTTYDNSAAPDTFFVFDKNVFTRKTKKYSATPNGFIVENKDLIDQHKKTKFVRKLFDSKYRSTYKNSIAKDVQLNAFAAIPKDFNLASTFDQIDMLFEVPNINDFDDFLIGTQSTELGLFEIELVTLTINQDIEFSMADGFEYANVFRNDIPLYDRAKPGSDSKYIDVANFTYSQERATYCLQITIAQILGNNDRIIGGAWKNKQMNKYNTDWKDSIMQDVQLQTFFSNINSLTLTIRITNAQLKDNQSYEYKFKCDSRIVCHYEGLPEESPAVKQFANPEKQSLIEKNFTKTGKFCEICDTGANVQFEDCNVEIANSKVPMMVSGGVVVSETASTFS